MRGDNAWQGLRIYGKNDRKIRVCSANMPQIIRFEVKKE